MEKIQCTALKYMYDNYKSCYVDLLERANMPFMFVQSMQSQRLLIHGSFQDLQQTRTIVFARFFLSAGNVETFRNNYHLVQSKCYSSTYGLN